MDSIGVLERYKSQGIGSRMLDAFAEWARGKAMPYIMLYVAVENGPAGILREARLPFHDAFPEETSTILKRWGYVPQRDLWTTEGIEFLQAVRPM